jgi:hypothetical protein
LLVFTTSSSSTLSLSPLSQASPPHCYLRPTATASLAFPRVHLRPVDLCAFNTLLSYFLNSLSKGPLSNWKLRPAEKPVFSSQCFNTPSLRPSVDHRGQLPPQPSPTTACCRLPQHPQPSMDSVPRKTV